MRSGPVEKRTTLAMAILGIGLAATSLLPGCGNKGVSAQVRRPDRLTVIVRDGAVRDGAARDGSGRDGASRDAGPAAVPGVEVTLLRAGSDEKLGSLVTTADGAVSCT